MLVPLPDDIVGSIVLPYLGADAKEFLLFLDCPKFTELLSRSLIQEYNPLFISLLLEQNSMGNNRCFFMAALSNHIPSCKYFWPKVDTAVSTLVMEWACFIGSLELLAFLLKKRPLNVFSWCLELACKFEHLKLVKLLLQHGAHPMKHNLVCMRQVSVSIHEEIKHLLSLPYPDAIGDVRFYVQISRFNQFCLIKSPTLKDLKTQIWVWDIPK